VNDLSDDECDPLTAALRRPAITDILDRLSDSAACGWRVTADDIIDALDEHGYTIIDTQSFIIVPIEGDT
jgi:predicted GNAT superfamily acetyltransferase